MSSAPLLRVMRGNPSAEELAVLIAVVAARAVGGGEPLVRPTSAWYGPQLRAPLHPGPGAWRAAGLPR